MASRSERRQRRGRNPPASQGAKTPWTLDRRQATFVFVVISLLASAFLHFSSDKIPDADALYHFRHAGIYGSAGPGGIFSADFPWTRYSVIGDYSADIWYGFHLLLVPFTWADDPILGLRLAGIFTTSLFLLLIYVACSRLDVRPAIFWPFFMLFSSAFLLHRLGMARPHVLSLALGVLLFGFLAHASVRGVFYAALASTFLHLSLFVVSILIFGVFAVVKLVSEKRFPWREALALAAGVLAGWILRPNPLGAAKIAYVQVFQLTLEKFGGAPLPFGSELLPLAFSTRNNFWLFALVWLGILSFWLRKALVKRAPLSNDARTLLPAAAALSTIFLVMSLLFARRAFEFFSGFGVVFSGLVFSRFLSEKTPARIALFSLFVILAPYSFAQREQAVNTSGKDPRRFESTAKWMRDNSEPGDIVFNINWDLFPELFFWNTKNVYVSGMDPIFQYAHDRRLFWEAHHLSRGMTEFTCPAAFCNETNLRRTYRVLKGDFKARYLFLAKPADLPLYYYLLSDSRFERKHENQSSAVFEIQ